MSHGRTTRFRPPTRDARRIVRAVRRRGGEVELTANNHLRVLANGRATVVGSHHTCPRSFRNAVAKIRRDTGLELGLTPA